ncbi:diacylglycerol/polyprenol kinase family protein [Neorhodopirellula pilleata]|uniref:Cytidylyltransferase family protein n=1 Tax=Neorhodopirellula pilleata TaxID=2714738 RepID=A0A5C5ZQT0_9BACT|nr:hypothetical protein [Neorhodopirellula pilleata]TWT89267.1 Cytidylyltransferase family protein [Neorhodopirellula pilleata]
MNLPTNYVWTIVLHQSFMMALCWATGWLVLKRDWKVNYTRKINHFVLMLCPFLLAPIFPYQPNVLTFLSTVVVFTLATLVMVHPIRQRFTMVSTAFAAVDRPEDRPHTLLWIISQAIVSAVILIGLFLVFQRFEIEPLISIPLVVTGVGDGLAEPIGIRFGKHTYRVPSLAKDRNYVRSIEGSACVLAVALATVACVYPIVSLNQWLALMLFVPAMMTAAEAFSPHTWDAPFLYLTGGLTIVCVMVVF